MTKSRALLLDRDGVINDDITYVGTIDRFHFLPDVFAFLRAVQDCGYRLAVLTNQSGVARGLYAAQDDADVTAHMLAELRREGIQIELTLAAFEHPEGSIPAYARESFWRKPNPGMVLESIRRLDLDPARSAFLGDTLRDMQAAQAGGIRRCLWLTQEQPPPPTGVTVVKDYAEAFTELSA
jgi:D-glycero-D-manno-heptose 1,7-bisphosphate phosphatase